MNIAAYHRHKRQLSAAQADYDNQCPEWPEEQDDPIETDEGEEL